jgi:hypothetical protein
MAATLWFHCSNGDDLLVPLHITQVPDFIRHLYDTGSDRGLFQVKPLFNHSLKLFTDDRPTLTVPEQETDVFSTPSLQVILAPGGFQPPSYMYTKIFLTTMEAALHILTGLPWSNFTKEEIMAEMDPYLHPAVEKGDSFAREILRATKASMEPKIIDIESMEHYIFLVTAPGRRFNLPYRQEPYDLIEPWKTEEELDAELDKYMNTPVTA